MLTFVHKGEKLTVRLTHYAENGRVAVVIASEDGQPYAKLSVNVKGVELAPDEFVVKTWSENEGLWQACKHLFIDTGKFCNVNTCPTTPIWRLRRAEKAYAVHKAGNFMKMFFTKESADMFADIHDAKVEETTITE